MIIQGPYLLMCFTFDLPADPEFLGIACNLLHDSLNLHLLIIQLLAQLLLLVLGSKRELHYSMSNITFKHELHYSMSNITVIDTKLQTVVLSSSPHHLNHHH